MESQDFFCENRHQKWFTGLILGVRITVCLMCLAYNLASIPKMRGLAISKPSHFCEHLNQILTIIVFGNSM